MGRWLYPIAKRAGRFFALKNGEELEVSIENYSQLVRDGRLVEDDSWGVNTNFHQAKQGDEIFIYTGDRNIGIIGYATILKVDQENQTFKLDFNLKRCKELLHKPVPAALVRKWGVLVWRGAVADLTPHWEKLRPRLPWKTREPDLDPAACDLGNPDPQRVTVQVTRVLRETALIRDLKILHTDTCQLCGTRLSFPDGRSYSEGHHLRPLGKPHNGPDLAENVLILCPNCHALCDYGAVRLVIKVLRRETGHKISERYVRYHNSKIALPGAKA